jgi:invasion protein IalB
MNRRYLVALGLACALVPLAVAAGSGGSSRFGEAPTLLAQAPAPRPQRAAPSRPSTAQNTAPQAQPAPQAESEPQAPRPVRTEILNFDNWTLTCVEYAEARGKQTCAATLQMVQAKSRQVLLAWTAGLGGDGRPVLTIQAPTGILIAPGVEVTLGKAKPRRIAFASCDTGHCTASAPLDEALVRELSAADVAEVDIQAMNGNNVQFKLPIKGFDKAYAGLRR